MDKLFPQNQNLFKAEQLFIEKSRRRKESLNWTKYE